MRVSARAIVFDGHGAIVLIRRTRPGGRPYLTTPGGGVLPGESWEQAAAREVLEETGAVVSVGPQVLTVQQHDPPPGAEQRFLLARLVDLDPARRTGHEFEEPERGTYETVRLRAGDPGLALLRPTELLELLRSTGEDLAERAARLV